MLSEMAVRLRMTGTYKAKLAILLGVLCLLVLVLILNTRTQASLGGNQAPHGESPEQIQKRLAEERRMEGLRAQLRKQMTKFIDKKTGALLIPKESVLKTLDMSELEEMYMRYIENTQVNCPRMLHIGWEYDGGYHMCETVVPNPPCLMYSFGIRKDFVFEDGVSTEYGCEVHAFDPFDGVDDFQQADKVFFHNMGIGGKNERITIFPNTPQEQIGTVKTLGSIKTLLGHSNRTINILKMDTEGAEWFSLAEQLKTGTLKGVTILIIEFHVWVGNANAFEHATHPVRSVNGYLRYLNDLRGLYEEGFRIYFFRMWTWCSFKDEIKNRRTACHEVHFMRDTK